MKSRLFISVLFAALTVNVKGAPDDWGTVIDLTGIPAPYSFRNYCRLSSPEMWVVGGGGQIIYESVNGRREFHPTKQDLYGVFFSTSGVGWVVGTDGTILHTKDAGEHWVVQDSGVKNTLTAITCIGEYNCWIVGGSGTVLRTNNGGEKWERMSRKSSADLNALHFINAQVGWAVGEDGLILNTQDGGFNWTEQYLKMLLSPNSEFATPTDLRAVIFIDEKRGWVAGTDWIARTVDGGKTWAKKNIESSFIGLVSQDGLNVWAISSSGANYVSKDSGKNWEKWIPQKNS